MRNLTLAIMFEACFQAELAFWNGVFREKNLRPGLGNNAELLRKAIFNMTNSVVHADAIKHKAFQQARGS